MARKKSEIKVLHASADYYEPLFRARFVRAMKALQKRTSINDLAMALGNHQQASNLVSRLKVSETLEPVKKIVRDAFMRGGKLGAEHVTTVLNGN